MFSIVVFFLVSNAYDTENSNFYPWVGSFLHPSEARYAAFDEHRRAVHQCLFAATEPTVLQRAIRHIASLPPVCNEELPALHYIVHTLTTPTTLACRDVKIITDPKNAMEPNIVTCLDALPRAETPCVAYHIGIADSWDWGDAMLDKCHVYSIDPEPSPRVPWSYQRGPRHTYLPVAIGRHERSHHAGASTLYGDAKKVYSETTLDAVMLMHGHSRVHFVRIDVEGAEFEAGVLRHWAACGLLERIDNLLIEFHLPPGIFSRPALLRHYAEAIASIRFANFTLYSSIHNPYDWGSPSYSGCGGTLYRVYETAWIRSAR